MARKAHKTIKDALDEVKSLKERAAVQLSLVGYLRGRYLPRDSMPSQAKIPCEGAPVREFMVEEIACELEESANEMIKEATAYLGTQIDG